MLVINEITPEDIDRLDMISIVKMHEDIKNLIVSLQTTEKLLTNKINNYESTRPDRLHS